MLFKHRNFAKVNALNILAMGQHGAAGHRGGKGQTGTKGKSGKDGIADFKYDSTFSDRGPGFKEWYCKQQTEDGKRGGRGSQGLRGGSGQVGGSSSSIFVQVMEAKDFIVTTATQPGLGGAGRGT